MARTLFIDSTPDIDRVWRKVHGPKDIPIAVNMGPVAASDVPKTIAGYDTVINDATYFNEATLGSCAGLKHIVFLGTGAASFVDLDAAARLGVGPFPRAALAMAGEIDGWLAALPALDAEDRLRGELAASRLRDAEAGTTSCGPHRSDLAVRHLDLDLPAAEGSTGQQKAVLVSIALAHARLVALSRGRAPLLLLDEIAAHLDAERRAALFDEVVALGVQSWMTGTDAGLFAPLGGRAQILRVADGSIAAV